MNFGEIKTTVFAALPEALVDSVSVFEFGEAIDDAQRLFAIVLPAETIPELVVSKFADPGADAGATGILPLPEDYLKAESVQFAQVRDSNNDPIRRDALIVPARKFEELVSLGSTERIASVYNNLLHLNPDPAQAVASHPSSVKLIYRKRPRPYTTTAGVLQQASRCALRQDVDSRHTFAVFDYGAAPALRPWSYWDLDVNELPGGYVYMGGPLMTDSVKGPLYIMRIVEAWDSASNVGYLRVSSDDTIPIYDEVSGVTGFTFPYCYVAQRPVFGYSGSAVEAGDHEFPDISASWHHLVCEYAVAKLVKKADPKAYTAGMQSVLQKLAAAGAKLEDAEVKNA